MSFDCRIRIRFSPMVRLTWGAALALWIGTPAAPAVAADPAAIEADIDALLATMSLDEKVGQMTLRGFSSRSTADPRVLQDAIRAGQIGALINVMDRATVDELQRIAVSESPHGIPLLFGRDVIHGFRTIFPIPLGQTASWNPELAERAARVAALEASTYGVRWTFAPMVDLTRDPRWGRIAESPGEDPLLAERFAVAMVQGFQGADLASPDSLAACLKHFVGYGAAEGGRDYNSATLSRSLLHNVYLRPFAAATRAGAATFMTAFNTVNGTPATGHRGLLRELLREEWGFDGLVVSDWESVTEMIPHGVATDEREAARIAALAGLDLEMTSSAFRDHLPDLVRRGEVPLEVVDDAVRNILRVKHRLGLFARPERDASRDDTLLSDEFRALAQESARQSLVLLQNDGILPLSVEPDAATKVAVIGPLADAPHEQLGTWTFDGKAADTHTPLTALRQRLGTERVLFAAGLEHSRDRAQGGFEVALEAARRADVVVFFGGEEAILSGEAHSRADLRLPGAQEALIAELAALGKPLVAVVLSGRPNTLEAVLPVANAVLIAWHPGTMGGPAIADVLFGDASPSGRLPVTWPISVGQIPIYYNHDNTGRPAPAELQSFDEIPVGAWQSSLSNTSRYLDLGAKPRFPFGFGLTYGEFRYGAVEATPQQVGLDDHITIRVSLENVGRRTATEVVQLYSRDPVGRIVRPVRELRDFRRVILEPGQQTMVEFTLAVADLEYVDEEGRRAVEPGEIQLFVGPDAHSGSPSRVWIVDAEEPASEAAER